MIIRLAGIVRESVVDGPGIRCAVFVQGCDRSCPGCHNPHTHALTDGYEQETAALAASLVQQPHLDGVTLTGGEPFLQAAACAALLSPLRAAGLHCLAYSGYTWEELQQRPDAGALLALLDVLVDGAYVAALRSPDLPWRGSRNQRLLDVPASRRAGRAVTLPE